MKRYSINLDECGSCGQCVEECKHHAVTIVSTHGYAHHVINDNCIGCGSCAKICPMEAIHGVD